MRRPKLLIIFAKSGTDTSTRFGGFVKRIKKNGGFKYADVDYVALEDLLFRTYDEHRAKVYDPIRHINLAKYSFVYFKSWQAMPELAASAALYLEGMGIPYEDSQVRHEFIAKTTNQMAMWSQGVSVPATIWGSKKVLTHYLKTKKATLPMIVKAVHGQKGNDNFLVQTRREARKIIEADEQDYVLQQFIPNDGDYRIGVYGRKSRWGIYRQSGGKSHLNNTSAGGTATQVDISKVDVAILRLAERAAEACDLAVSGVDIVKDKTTQKLYVLEANQGSQIVTGAFSDTNMTAFDAGMKSMIRQSKRSSKRPVMIGRDLTVRIGEDEDALEFRAKVDTGAYQSALHAKDIHVLRDENGREFLQYTVVNHGGEQQVFTSYDFGRATIKSSNGMEEKRYVAPVTVEIHDIQYSMRVSLTNRGTQKYPLLIGRRLLIGNFIVNPALSEIEE